MNNHKVIFIVYVFFVSILTSGIISVKKSEKKSEKRSVREKSEINIGIKKWDVNIIGL